MATRTYYKVVMDECVLPDIYTSYDMAESARRRIAANNSPCSTRLVNFDDQTGEIY